MSKVITAKVYIRDSCDPNSPGDCAPVFRVEGAAELEGLVSEHGISFEEPIHEQEETFADDLVDDDELWEDIVEDVDVPEAEGDPVCDVEPDLPWDESVCGKIERRILSRVLGG